MKKKLLISFSGGETSAFMAQWLWKHKQDEYDMIFVFANTGQENEETLMFVQACSDHFGFPVVWVESLVYQGIRLGSSFKIVNFQTASRDGQPFEEVIKKYGIPNRNAPHCTRELKQNPIKAYAKAIGWKDYYLAIGIRSDEIDRMNAKKEENRIIYPLISSSMIPMTKPKINFFWKMQSFRLMLKGYQGNCKTCWKKSDAKLFQIAKENERDFLFFGKMELRYGKFVPDTRLKKLEGRGETVKLPINFFRGDRSVQDIINESNGIFKVPIDDSEVYPNHEQLELYDLESREFDQESCEPFSQCGDDN
jgi:hypothetical protein